MLSKYVLHMRASLRYILNGSESGSKLTDLCLQPRKRRKVGGYIPRERFTSSQRNIEIVKLPDVEQEYALLTANMELLRRDPTLMRHGGELMIVTVTDDMLIDGIGVQNCL